MDQGTTVRSRGLSPRLRDTGALAFVASELLAHQADDDRRSVVLRTSPGGEKLLDKVKEDIMRRYQHLFRQLDSSEQAKLAGAISILVRVLEKAIEGERGK